jgi:hypothetical protein
MSFVQGLFLVVADLTDELDLLVLEQRLDLVFPLREREARSTRSIMWAAA